MLATSLAAIGRGECSDPTVQYNYSGRGDLCNLDMVAKAPGTLGTLHRGTWILTSVGSDGSAFTFGAGPRDSGFEFRRRQWRIELVSALRGTKNSSQFRHPTTIPI